MDKTYCDNCEEPGHQRENCTSLPIANLKAAQSKNGRGFEFQEPRSDIKIVDTHCHVDAVFERIRHRGNYEEFKSFVRFPPNIRGCISSFSDPVCYGSLGMWEDLFTEDGVWGTFGIHPHSAKYYNDDLEAKLISCLKHPKALAVGECGLDYSARSASPRDQQHAAFRRQLRVAVHFDKPVVIHCREAETDCFQIMKDALPSNWKIHLHCYTGDSSQAEEYLSHFPNLYFGVTNLVTYPTATQVHHVTTDLPLRKLVLETDAPYFVPNRLKGTTRFSTPGMVMYVAAKLAEFHRCSLDKVLETCQKNAENLYGISF